MILLFTLFCAGQAIIAQDKGYSNAPELKQRIDKLKLSQLVDTQVIAKSASGKDIYAITISKGDHSSKPAIAIVGGINGKQPIGQELAIGVAESLVNNASVDSISQLLDQVTFYVLPAVNPDATAQYFAPLKYARNENGRSTDNDRDGRTDEDRFEDLDGNNLITMIRVKDPTGAWGIHSADDRVMINNPKDAGDRYHLYTEGLDNDKDGQYNEDGPGGVAFNKNLTYQHPTFKSGAGEYPVSETETKGVLDFLYDRWNVFAVISLGASDNLQAPMTYNKGNAEKRVITSLLEDDAALNKEISELYNKETGLKSKAVVSNDGDFMQWVYFHYGRQSYGAAGWQVPEWKIPKDSVEATKFKHNHDKNKEVNHLRWADSVGINVYTPWTVVEHPDFPNRTVEVGGVHPFVWLNPPQSDITELATKHSNFIYQYAKKAPHIAIANQKVESLANGVSRISVDVFNSGQLGAMTQIGEQNRWVKKPKIVIELDENQQLVGGKPVNLLDNLKPGEPIRHTWLVKGKGNVVLSAGCPQLGTEQLTLNLK